MRDIGINLDKNFATLGSFWQKQFFGEEKQHAKTLSSLGVYNNLHTIRENFKNNVQNIAEQYITNHYTKLPTPLDLEKGYKIPFTQPIKISHIKPIIKTSPKSIYLAGFDFRQTKDSLIFKENPINLFGEALEVNINGEYKLTADEMQYRLKCVAGIDNMQLGYRTQYINDYIHGANQSPVHFELMLNASLGCNILQRAGTIAKVIENTEAEYTRYIFEEGFIEDVYYPISHLHSVSSKLNQRDILDKYITITTQYNDEESIMEITFDDNRMSEDLIEKYIKIIKELLPLGWTPKFYKYTTKEEILK